MTVESTVVADATSIKAKIVAYVKAHATPTVIGTVAGFAVGKFSIIGLVIKAIKVL